MVDDKFRDHLDVCERCEKEPFNLCPLGARLLREAAQAGGDSMLRGQSQWNTVLRNSETS